jgi:2-polyprenyl-3-methyl-5-hydroxy-6-metoxy-1,4-benzoquinol methylase
MNRFDAMAATWEANPRRAERARITAQAIADRVPLQRSWSMVDIGSGTGLLSRALADRVGTVLLLDTSPGMTEVAREQIDASGLTTLSALTLDITLETPPGSPFDLAVSPLMLHHVEDVEGFLETVLCQLTPGGYIAFADLAAEDGTFHDDPTEEVHHRGFEPGRLAAMATSAGFVDVSVEEVHQMVKQRGGQDRSYGLLLLTGRVPVTVVTP